MVCEFLSRNVFLLKTSQSVVSGLTSLLLALCAMRWMSGRELHFPVFLAFVSDSARLDRSVSSPSGERPLTGTDCFPRRLRRSRGPPEHVPSINGDGSHAVVLVLVLRAPHVTYPACETGPETAQGEDLLAEAGHQSLS